MKRPVFWLAAALALAPAGCGRKSYKEFTPPEGGFTVLLPGTPRTEQRPLNGGTATVYLADTSGGLIAAGYADFSPGTAVNLPAAVDGMSSACDGRVVARLEGFAGDDEWTEFEIESGSPGGYVSGRLMMIGGRFYLVFAAGKAARRTDLQTRLVLDSFKLTGRDFPWPDFTPRARPPAPLWSPPRPPAETPPARPAPTFPAVPPVRPFPPPPSPPADEIVGFPIGTAFTDPAPANSLLVGFELGYRRFTTDNYVCTIRAVYRSPAGSLEVVGPPHGKEPQRVERVVAPPGYAVGAVAVRAGLFVDGISVTFMRVAGDRLDPTDARPSGWLGGAGGGEPKKLGGDGTPVVGIRGRVSSGNDLNALGLILQGRGGR